MKKKILLVFLCVFLLAAIFGGSALADSETIQYPVDGGFIYFNTSTGHLAGYSGEIKNLDIPSTIAGVKVTGVNNNAFMYCTSLESISLPEGVSEIPYMAFTGCTALKEVYLPDGLKTIGFRAFGECESLSVLHLPEGLELIEQSAFSGCNGLRELVLPQGLTELEKTAFAYCTGLESVYIPGTVKTIRESAFEGCSALRDLEIGYGVEKFARNVFKLCSSLESVYLPGSITELGYEMFLECDNLKRLEFGEGITEIGYIVWKCPKLSEIILPDSLELLGMLFFCNENIRTVELPAGVKIIADKAFAGCINLESIVLPEGLKEIWENAFTECKSLKSITLPSTLIKMEAEAFANCTGLEKVVTKSGALGERAFVDCTALKTVIIGSGTKEIPVEAFMGCKALVDLNLPVGLEIIKERAFKDCHALRDVVIPDGVKKICMRAFDGCADITSLTFPLSIEYIDQGFVSCHHALNDVYYAGSEEQWKGVFISMYDEALLRPLRGYPADIDIKVATMHYNSLGPDLFMDVSSGDWFYSTVMAAARAGFIAGKPDGTFAPQEELSWAQAVTLAVRYAQSARGEYVYTAEDQTGDNWYDIYFEYALGHGFISAMPANPNGIINRGDAAVLFAVVLGSFEQINEVPEGYFTDVPNEGPVHDAIYTLAEAGICNGKGGGVFGTNESFKRSEVATIIARMAGLVKPAELA